MQGCTLTEPTAPLLYLSGHAPALVLPVPGEMRQDGGLASIRARWDARGQHSSVCLEAGVFRGTQGRHGRRRHLPGLPRPEDTPLERVDGNGKGTNAGGRRRGQHRPGFPETSEIARTKGEQAAWTSEWPMRIERQSGSATTGPRRSKRSSWPESTPHRWSWSAGSTTAWRTCWGSWASLTASSTGRRSPAPSSIPDRWSS